MTANKSNPIWNFFASVQLAIFLLFILAATSVIGTLIPQNSPPAFYLENYGAKATRLMQVLGATDMYNAWWFLALLSIFALNLIVCSLERIPRVLAILWQDNLATSRERLAKMNLRRQMVLPAGIGEATDKITAHLAKKGWQARNRTSEDGTLLFAEKGGWTRFGVYIVHTSILIIFLGALVGSPTIASLLGRPGFAFKGSVMLPETRQTDHVFAYDTGQKINLGFTLRCDLFTIDYYPGGMPKTYLSKVTVLENDGTHYSTDITVNNPLTHRGITFYQSSYEPQQQFIVTLKNLTTNAEITEILPAARQSEWSEEQISFGIINVEASRQVTRRVKIWFNDEHGTPSNFWLETGRQGIIERPETNYAIQVRQMYATGLQVAKDPGVWFVYLGCVMMLAGLLIAFFLSHRKIFAWVETSGDGTAILFAGSANKNKVGFEKKFNQLLDDFQA